VFSHCGKAFVAAPLESRRVAGFRRRQEPEQVDCWYRGGGAPPRGRSSGPRSRPRSTRSSCMESPFERNTHDRLLHTQATHRSRGLCRQVRDG
jgi:hypothetical protein